MENLNVLNDTGVVDEAPQEQAEVTGEVISGEDTNVTPKIEEVAKPRQNAEENSKYAEARRQAEAEAKAVKAQNERLLQALGQYGYDGTPDEIADAILAQTKGISVEEATAQREAQEKADLEKQTLLSETEFYKKIAIEKMMADDLAKIKSVYPDVKSLEELGNEFFSLLGATKDPLLSYEAVQAKKAKTLKPTPQDIGAVNSASSKEKDFYTPSEVDKLTSKDYDNPKIMERVRASMLKWK